MKLNILKFSIAILKKYYISFKLINFFLGNFNLKSSTKYINIWAHYFIKQGSINFFFLMLITAPTPKIR